MNSLEQDHILFEWIKGKLNLSENALIIEASDIKNAITPLTVDLIIQDKNNTYFIETKKRIRIDTVAKLTLLRELLNKYDYDISNYIFVIVSDSIPMNVEKMANLVKIVFINIPKSIQLNDKIGYHIVKRGKVKITSEKSWKIVTRLLKEKMTSIRQLSLLEDVSYGWAHATIQGLIKQGIVTKKKNYVSISNIEALLNGVSWERYFENLFTNEININFDNAHLASLELSKQLKQQNVNFAFTAYTAGGLYTGYAIRYDSVYLYLEKDKIDLFTQLFEEKEEKGIKVRIYVPDRELFNDCRDLEGIRLVSPAQVLLDLAGLGYSGRDITKVLVDKYASL